MSCPASSTSWVAMRGTKTTGPSKRSSSSTAPGITAGSAAICRRSAGWAASAANAVLSADVTVSRPASTNRNDRPRISVVAEPLVAAVGQQLAEQVVGAAPLPPGPMWPTR